MDLYIGTGTCGCGIICHRMESKLNLHSIPKRWWQSSNKSQIPEKEKMTTNTMR